MHEDVDQIGHCLRLLSRVITLIAVILAVPVILSTITAFVRNPPEVSTFHNLLGTAFRGHTIVAERTPQKSTPWQANLADPQEASATETEKSAPEGPLLVDHPRDAPPSAPSAGQNSALPMVADGADGTLPPLTANDGAPADRTDPVAPMGPASAIETEAHALSASSSWTDPAATAKTSRRRYGPHGRYNAVKCADAATPTRGRQLRRAAGRGDQQPICSTAAAITVVRRQRGRDIFSGKSNMRRGCGCPMCWARTGLR